MLDHRSHTSRGPARIALLAAVLALTAASAGCGSSSGSNADKTGTTTTMPAKNGSAGSGDTTTTAGATATPTKGGANPIDVCATIDAAKAAQVSGLAITLAEPNTGLQPKEYGCTYEPDDRSAGFNLTVFEHDAVHSYNIFSTGTKNKTAVSGVGDKAFYNGDGTLYALAGNTIIQVNGLEGADKCAAVARAVIAAL